jgi:hypothetical protein
LPLLTITIVPDAEAILRLAVAEVDCRLKLTAGRPLLIFWPLFLSFGESKRRNVKL